MSEKNNNWDLVIEPQSSLFNLNLRDVWRYRELLWMFVKRDFVSFYKQTILGPLWFFIQPLFTTFTYTIIFGGLANLSTDGLPEPLFYMAGITAWNYFSDCINKTSTVLKDNANIFGKVYFPRLILPLSIVASNLVRFGIQMLLMIIMMIYYYYSGANFHVTWAIILLPLLVGLMAFLGLGIGLVITALTTKYRDLSFLITFGVQLLMYTTTVIYPFSSAPDNYKFMISLNPMTGIIECLRYALFGQGDFSFYSIFYSVLITFVSLISGILVFNKIEKSFVDNI